jgi:hypothetical protein
VEGILQVLSQNGSNLMGTLPSELGYLSQLALFALSHSPTTGPQGHFQVKYGVMLKQLSRNLDIVT